MFLDSRMLSFVRYSCEEVCSRIPQDEEVTAITNLLHGGAVVFLNSRK